MSTDAALLQLLEMGIPGGRARAALARTKGDAMAAAERVFAGEYDDVASDDEGEEEGALAAGMRASSPAKSAGLRDDVSMRAEEDDSLGADADDDGGDSDGFDGFDSDEMEDDSHILDQDDMDREPHLLSDPYAGIFFDKSRTETCIETVDSPELVNVAPPVVGEAPAQWKGKTEVRLLGRGEWMSGCPEGNEQLYLFTLYDKLQGDMPCASGKDCGHVFTRNKSDFFAVFPDFKMFLSHLSSRVRAACPNCDIHTCMLCGSSCAAAVRQPIFAKTVKRGGTAGGTQSDANESAREATKEMKPDVVEVDELLHCEDLQGLIVGMGLQILEQTFAGKSEQPTTTPNTPHRSSKRQRTHTSSDKKDTAAQPPVPAPKVPKALAIPKYTSMEDEEDSEMDDDDDAFLWSGLHSAAWGNSSAKGTGYAGAGTEDRSGQLKAQEAQRERDATCVKVLREVRAYLPLSNRASGTRRSDHMVHPTTLAHLRRRSAFVNSMLRNDSLLDMSNRSDLYQALFDWLEVISNHEALASMLAMPQMRAARRTRIDSPNDSKESHQVEVLYEGAPSPRELLENIVIQAQAALKGLSTTKDVTAFDKLTPEARRRLSRAEAERMERDSKDKQKDDANEALRAFCVRIVASAEKIDKSLRQTKGAAFVERMRDALPRLPGAPVQGAKRAEDDVGKQASGATTEAVIKIYEEWAGRVRFDYADMRVSGESGVFKHAYSKDLAAIENVTAPRRSLAIAKELAILTTNLPVAWHSSVFLRVDEARVDCIKALIIGPEGTPYENGAFVFDIFLPADYSNKCPLVKSMTTNGGRYRLNPNLYACGKVCLSLLGTWNGPGWISGQSTLLQVLISIQSLILNSEPYLNEPGWASQGGSPASKAYSANIRRMVMHDAMANSIRNPPYPFADIIRTHYRLKAGYIREQLDRWSQMDDGVSTESDGALLMGGAARKKEDKPRSGPGSDFQKKAADLRALLDELEGVDGQAKEAGASASASEGKTDAGRGAKGGVDKTAVAAAAGKRGLGGQGAKTEVEKGQGAKTEVGKDKAAETSGAGAKGAVAPSGVASGTRGKGVKTSAAAGKKVK